MLPFVHAAWCRYHKRSIKGQTIHTQIAKFMGPTWGPTGSCRSQMGPMSAPWTLLSGYTHTLTCTSVQRHYHKVKAQPQPHTLDLHTALNCNHDDVIKHFPRYWPFVRGNHRSPVNSPHKGQWRGTLMFSLICARINGWVSNDEAGGLRRQRAHYDVIVMIAVRSEA